MAQGSRYVQGSRRNLLTTGQVMQAQTIPLASLILGERQRKEYPDDQILRRADSIQRTRGLLHPIVIDPKTGVLIAGGCRTRAYGLLMMRAEADRAAGKYVPEDN